MTRWVSWCAAAAAAVAVAVGCAPTPRSAVPAPAETFFDEAWRDYTSHYLHPSGYVLDRTRGGGEVTSEGQAYALLRAAWVGDRPTFERVLRWTERTLARRDGLFAWHWSPAGGGRVLDAHAATDADEDIAFALILAGVRFGHRPYLARAARTVKAIRTQTGIRLPVGWLPSAGDWAVGERIVNLSYFAPYAYPYFARLDPEGDWPAAIEAGYGLLARAVSGPGRRLPPDFAAVDRDGALVALPAGSTLPRRFSFDAIRIAWRVEFDCRLHGRESACAGAGGALSLAEMLAGDGRLVTQYEVSGDPRTDDESPTFYASVLPALMRLAPASGGRVRAARLSDGVIRPLLARDDRYYDANWIWFGLALADGWLVPRTPPVQAVRLR